MTSSYALRAAAAVPEPEPTALDLAHQHISAMAGEIAALRLFAAAVLTRAGVLGDGGQQALEYDTTVTIGRTFGLLRGGDGATPLVITPMGFAVLQEGNFLRCAGSA